jgi:hypothetical protein
MSPGAFPWQLLLALLLLQHEYALTENHACSSTLPVRPCPSAVLKRTAHERSQGDVSLCAVGVSPTTERKPHIVNDGHYFCCDLSIKVQ